MSKTTRYSFVFLCCVLAMPTCVYGLNMLWAREPFDALLAGALLGLAHVLLRPVLRLVTKPIGCLTFGLSSFAIDVALIYGCAYALDGFYVTSLPHAMFAAFLVNTACLIVGGRH